MSAEQGASLLDNQAQPGPGGYGATPEAQQGDVAPNQQQPGGYVPPPQPGGYVPPPGSQPTQAQGGYNPPQQPSVVCEPAPMPDWQAGQPQPGPGGYGATPAAQQGYVAPNQQQQQPGGYVPPPKPGGYVPPPGSQPAQAQGGYNPPPPAPGQPVMGAAVPPSQVPPSHMSGASTAGYGMPPPQPAAPQPGNVHQIAMAAASGAGPTSIIAAAPESHLRAQDGPEEQGTYKPEAVAPFETRHVLMTNAYCFSVFFIGGALLFGWAIMPQAYGWDIGVPLGIVGTVIAFAIVWGYLRSQAIAGTKGKAEFKYLDLKNPQTLEQYYQRLIMYDQAAPAMVFHAKTEGHSAVGDFRYTNWTASKPLITLPELQQMAAGARWVQIVPKLKVMFANGLTKVSYNTQIKEFRQVNERGTVIYITESLSLKPTPAPGVPTVVEHSELGSGWLCLAPGTNEEISKSLFPCNALQKGNPEQFVVIPRDVRVLEVNIEKTVDTMAVVAHATAH